jgi:hypothetical protein
VDESAGVEASCDAGGPELGESLLHATRTASDETAAASTTPANRFPSAPGACNNQSPRMMSHHGIVRRVASPATKRRALALGLALCAILAGGACRKKTPPAPPAPAAPIPTESMAAVTGDSAPALIEIEDDEAPAMVLHQGDLALLQRDLRTLKWRAPMENGIGTRDGAMVEIRLAEGGSIFFAFRSDFGDAVQVPTSKWICEKIGESDPLCAQSLARSRTRSGAFVAWWPRVGVKAPVAVIRDGDVKVVHVLNPATGRLVEFSGGAVLLLTTHRASPDGRHSEGALVAVRVSGGDVAILEPMPTDEIDARDEKRVIQRIVKTELKDDTVYVMGERRVVARSDAAVLETAPVDERHRLPDLKTAHD